MTDSISPCPFVFAPLLLSTSPTTLGFVECKSIAAASAAIGVPTECPINTVGSAPLSRSATRCNGVKVVRAGTLQPPQADSPKFNDFRDGREGVWRNKGTGQEDKRGSLFGSVADLEPGNCLRHSIHVSFIRWEQSGNVAKRVLAVARRSSHNELCKGVRWLRHIAESMKWKKNSLTAILNKREGRISAQKFRTAIVPRCFPSVDNIQIPTGLEIPLPVLIHLHAIQCVLARS